MKEDKISPAIQKANNQKILELEKTRVLILQKIQEAIKDNMLSSLDALAHTYASLYN
jgi:hypothetical protein